MILTSPSPSPIRAGDDASTEAHFDFRNGHVPPELTPRKGAERFLHPEPGGLRVTISREELQGQRPALITATSLKADFDVTLTFEVLDADDPEAYSAYRVGFFLALPSENKNARIGWFAMPNRKQVIDCDIWDEVRYGVADESMQHVGSKSGRLRLKRTGEMLQYLWSPELTGDNFSLIHKCAYPDEVKFVRLVAETRQGHRNLDVRYLDLHIRGGSVSAPPQNLSPLMVLLTVLVLVLLATWFYRRQVSRNKVT
jgi:hypothetical protein